MKIIITGANGFVGQHLAQYFAQKDGDITLVGTCYEALDVLPSFLTDALDEAVQLDIREPQAVHELIERVQPAMIFHLAAQSSAGASFKDPWGTLETNSRGTLNILEAMRQLGLSETRMINVSTASIYGIVQPADLPVREDQPFNPGDPYGVSKITQDFLGLQYAKAYDLAVISARPFNHTGPRQPTHFVLPNFAMQIARIEHGLDAPVLNVGNLEAERDFLDVRDVLSAYDLLAQKGVVGQAYNICRGEAYRLGDLVDRLIGLARVDIAVQVDEERLRPLDLPRLVGDNTKLRQDTGWEPRYSIDEMLKAVLDDGRERLKNEQNLL